MLKQKDITSPKAFSLPLTSSPPPFDDGASPSSSFVEYIAVHGNKPYSNSSCYCHSVCENWECLPWRRSFISSSEEEPFCVATCAENVLLCCRNGIYVLRKRIFIENINCQKDKTAEGAFEYIPFSCSLGSQISSKSAIVHAACGIHHIIICDTLGNVYSCGDNKFGQLGTGDFFSRKTFTPIPLHDNETEKNSAYKFFALKVYAGHHFSFCIARGDGPTERKCSNIGNTLMAWGRNDVCQLGIDYSKADNMNDKRNASSEKVLPEATLTNLQKHCVATPREVYCKLGATDGWIDLSAGFGYTLAILGSKRVVSFGLNLHGQLGLGYRCEKVRTPQVIEWFGSIPIKQVACGVWHSLVLSEFGQIFTVGITPNFVAPPSWQQSIRENPQKNQQFRELVQQQRSPTTSVEEETTNLDEETKNFQAENAATCVDEHSSILTDEADEFQLIENLPIKPFYISAGSMFSAAIGEEQEICEEKDEETMMNNNETLHENGRLRVIVWGVYGNYLENSNKFYAADYMDDQHIFSNQTIVGKPISERGRSDNNMGNFSNCCSHNESNKNILNKNKHFSSTNETEEMTQTRNQTLRCHCAPHSLYVWEINKKID